MCCALGILFYFYIIREKKVCLPFYLFSFKPLFRHAAESTHRLKNAVRGQTDEVCAAQGLISHSGLCWRLIAPHAMWMMLLWECPVRLFQWSGGHCPLSPLRLWDSWPGHAVGTVNKHGVAWCEVSPQAISPMRPSSPLPLAEDLMRCHVREQADMPVTAECSTLRQPHPILQPLATL